MLKACRSLLDRAESCSLCSADVLEEEELSAPVDGKLDSEMASLHWIIV